MRKGDRILVVPSLCTAQAERVRGTLASPFAGYSPINRGSTHCFTLSSVNLGVAYRTKERHSQRTCVKNNICIWIGLCHVIVKIIQSAILLSSKFWGHHCALRWSTPSEKLQLWCRCSQGVWSILRYLTYEVQAHHCDIYFYPENDNNSRYGIDREHIIIYLMNSHITLHIA
jgi:hypothetical protein